MYKQLWEKIKKRIGMDAPHYFQMKLLLRDMEQWEAEAKEVYPLHTKSTLAKRWGVDRQTVQNWSARHTDFCEPIEGLVAGSGTYYPLHEVKRYERVRGLNK